jgi:bacteriorhodopsin
MKNLKYMTCVGILCAITGAVIALIILAVVRKPLQYAWIGAGIGFVAGVILESMAQMAAWTDTEMPRH